jgi:XTP/dITP diphosphohydrolase
LISSPRLPAGILSAAAWDALRAAPLVLAGTEFAQVGAVRAAGVEVAVQPAGPALDALLTDGGVWLAGPDGDEHLSHKLAERLAADPAVAELELLYGSWDPPGARLLDVVAVMDRLRSPGGCPWDAEQTHRSLAPYLLEEAYETVDAIESGNADDLREELGDLLLQPVFHARLAAESEPGFGIDEVAGDLVDKLLRRHPHVFGGEPVEEVADLHGRWDALKAAEKPERRYATDGVALAQPALSLASKYLSRTRRAGVSVPLAPAAEDVATATDSDVVFGETLLALVAAAAEAGIDPELALRSAALDFAARARKVQDETR